MAAKASPHAKFYNLSTAYTTDHQLTTYTNLLYITLNSQLNSTQNLLRPTHT